MDDGLFQVNPCPSVSGFHLGSLIISGDLLWCYDKLRELNQAIFLQGVIWGHAEELFEETVLELVGDFQLVAFSSENSDSCN